MKPFLGQWAMVETEGRDVKKRKQRFRGVGRAASRRHGSLEWLAGARSDPVPL